MVRRNKEIIALFRITGDTRTHSKQVAEIIKNFNAIAVPDFGYGDTKNKDLIEWFPERIWMCVYVEGVMFPKLKEKERIVNIDRTRSIQEELAEIKARGKIGEKFIYSNEEVETFISHHLNLTLLKKEDKHGKIREEVGRSGDDHFVHANNYARLLESGAEQESGEIGIFEVGQYQL